MAVRLPRIGVLLPTRGVLLRGENPPQVERLLALAESAEEAGCDAVWVGDSLTAKPRLEALCVLAAVAVRTRRVRLGTAVLLTALRHPVLFAQAAATVDLLSGGRLTLGMGVGGAFTPAQQAEWRAAGVDQRRRARRLEEAIEIARRLWTGEKVIFEGEHFSLGSPGFFSNLLDGVSLGFRPWQRPGIPILLACHGGAGREAQYRRAARLADGMISITDSPEEFGRVRAHVLREVRGLGRDPHGFPAVFYMTVNINHSAETARQEAAAWIIQYYGADYWGDRWGPYGRPEAVIERILRYSVAGADEVIIRFASDDQAGQLDLFAREVLQALK
jgi:alkanesulfonate monooxygenase SsuD/methylene tetrahydromethanopterin reductase-like flavin-dependent oxidoreductase (luciferase family)